MFKIKIYTLCDGSGLSSISSSRLPDIARFISGPASCNVRKPALKNTNDNKLTFIHILL